MTATATTRRSNGARQRKTAVRDFVDRHRSTSIIIGMTLFIVGIYFLVLIPPFSFFNTQVVWLNNFANAGVFVLLALGLNVVVGLAGLLDLGYAAFFAFGAYTYAFGASPFSQQHYPFLLMIVVGAAIAAIFGVLLGAPTLRLRGDYLAIMTLGFGEIVPIVFLNTEPYTQGTNGIGGIYRPDIPGIGEFGVLDNFKYFALMAVILTATMVLLYRLQDSRIGRAWMAIREDELAAAASGINTVTTKLLAFALGATTAGFAGVYNASKLTIVSPNQFLFQVSFTVLAMVVLGGMGNIWGVALGAFFIFLIQAVFLTQLNTFFDQLRIPVLSDVNFLEYQFLLYGVALVLMMLFRPEGLFPSQRRRRELHAVEELGDGAGGAQAGGLGEAPQ
jgi:ABC-type branched-subunit amino acid transport system permease subunit